MLKIIDNINLKQLEKYGFKRPQYVKAYLCTVKVNRNPADDTHYQVDLPSRKINVWSLGEVDLNLLYDLMQDGLIEKVGD